MGLLDSWDPNKRYRFSLLKRKYLHNLFPTAAHLDLIPLCSGWQSGGCFMCPLEAHLWFWGGPVTLSFSPHCIQWCLSATSAMITGETAGLTPPLWANFLWGPFTSKVLINTEGRIRKPWWRTTLCKTWDKHERAGWLSQGQLAGAQSQSALGHGVERINLDQMSAPASACS